MTKKKKGRKFPYFDVDLNSITKTSKTMTIVDRNSIQTEEFDVDEHGKEFTKRVYNPDRDAHIVKEVAIPASTAPEIKKVVSWMMDMSDPRYTIVYDHRRNSLHVEYATGVWLEYLADVYNIEKLEEDIPEPEDEDEEDLEE